MPRQDPSRSVVTDPVATNELVTRAWALLSRCGGIEEAGMPVMAAETRVLCRALLETIDELTAERSARIALQDRCNAQQAILGRAVYQAIP